MLGEASHCVAGGAQVCWGRLATVLQEGHRKGTGVLGEASGTVLQEGYRCVGGG